MSKHTECTFNKEEINFLGHIVSEIEIKPNYKKIKAIQEMFPPKNLKQLRTFLGMIAYLINLSQTAVNWLTQ